MQNRTKKSCQVCGKPFYGPNDYFYCPECAREKKIETVVRIRTCQDCGVEFFGGPRARRCPDCASKAKAETSKQHRMHGTRRPLGSIDKCQWCGAEYTVICGRQKYCSDKCQKEAVLEWQREHKKSYSKTSRQYIKQQERRKQAKKICVYCGRIFTSDKPTNICSEYCRKEQRKITQCIADIKRGYNRDMQKYIDKRDEYRREVMEETRKSERDQV